MAVDFSGYSAEDVARAQNWPKVELHLHLDGSLSPEFIAERAAARGVHLPAPREGLRDWLMQQKLQKLKKDDNKASSGGNWPVFDWCNQFLQTTAELRDGTADLLARLGKEGVVYAEIRFCPALHTLEGLTEEQVVRAVLEGVGGQEEVVAGLVLAALRSRGEQHGVDTARLADTFRQEGVVGMDVAGDEGSFPLAGLQGEAMVAGVEEAERRGVPLTLHAGEWPERFGSLANLEWAVGRPGVRRVGHGIAVRSGRHLLEQMKRNNITVEVCLTSNIGNGFKVANYGVHPVKLLQEAGVQYSLSSDNLLLSGDLAHRPGPTAEILHLVRDVGLGWPAARQSVLAGLRAAFSPRVDQTFIDKVDKRMGM